MKSTKVPYGPSDNSAFFGAYGNPNVFTISQEAGGGSPKLCAVFWSHVGTVKALLAWPGGRPRSCRKKRLKVDSHLLTAARLAA